MELNTWWHIYTKSKIYFWCSFSSYSITDLEWHCCCTKKKLSKHVGSRWIVIEPTWQTFKNLFSSQKGAIILPYLHFQVWTSSLTASHHSHPDKGTAGFWFSLPLSPLLMGSSLAYFLLKQHWNFSAVGPSTWNGLPLTWQMLPHNNAFYKLLLSGCSWTQGRQSWRIGGSRPPDFGQGGRGEVAGGHEILLYLSCTGSMFESGDCWREIE